MRAVALRLGLAIPDGESLKRARRFDADGALNDTEETLVAFFRAHGPVVTFGELFEVSQAAGDVPRRLDRLLTRSPIIRRVRQGLYTLVGTPLTRQEIADAARMQPTQSGGELRYNVDGTVTYAASASAWLLHSSVLNAAELRPFEGAWQTVSGTRVTIRGQTAWGLGKAIRALDLAVGERVALRLDTWEPGAPPPEGSAAVGADVLPDPHALVGTGEERASQREVALRPRRLAGFGLDFRNETMSAPRSRYEETTKTIVINLDHPQLKAARKLGPQASAAFRQMSYELAFVEYALALGNEHLRRDPLISGEDALYEIRETINRVTRRIGDIF